MKLIRLGTFETNSSSCHSVTVFKTADYIRFKNGELFYIGDYEYSDDHDTYYNDLKSEDFLTIEEIRDRTYNYINNNANMASLRASDAKSGWGTTYRAAEFLLKTNPSLDFYKRVFSENDKCVVTEFGYEPTVFDSELKRDHYGQSESGLNARDFIIKSFADYVGSYVQDFITDTVLGCQTGRNSFYDMFHCDVYPVGDPIEVGDQTIIRTYISC